MQSNKYANLFGSGKSLHAVVALVAVSSLVLVGVISGSSAVVFAAKFRATMSGDNEIPPVETPVSGYTAFRTASNDTIIKYKVNITGLYDTAGAHIHQGKIGENGDVIVDLLNNSKKNKIGLGMAIRGNISDSDLIGPMKGKSLVALLSAIESGDTYVNIRTPDHPNGIIRGPIESESGNNANQSSPGNVNVNTRANG